MQMHGRDSPYWSIHYRASLRCGVRNEPTEDHEAFCQRNFWTDEIYGLSSRHKYKRECYCVKYIVALDNIINLAKTIDARLPSVLPIPSPITFPEKLDKDAAAKYFKSITFGKFQSNGIQVAPQDAYGANDVVGAVLQGQTQHYSTAVYDVPLGKYIRKTVMLSDKMLFLRGDRLPAGKYEYRVAFENILVAVFPFEVR